MPVRDIYLRIEPLEGYSPVSPMAKTAPPIQYKRDCLYGTGHGGGVIPEAEVTARSLTALAYRQYRDPDFLVPVVDKLVEADINEPIYSRRVPGTVIYAHPGETLRITVFNADSEPHSFHLHGLEYGIDSDGSWPLGTASIDGRRSDEICPGSWWTYTYEVTEESVGAWPFHDHSSHHPTDAIDRGLFGGIVVLPEREEPPPRIELPDHLNDALQELRPEMMRFGRRPALGPGPHLPHRPLDPLNLMPGAVRPRPDLAERVRTGGDVVLPHLTRGGGRHGHGGHGGPGAGGPGAGGHSGEEPLPAPQDPDLLRRQHLDLLDEWVLSDLVQRPGPRPELPLLHVPLFFHVLKDDRVVPAFDSGDLEDGTGVYELNFVEAGSFEYFCRYHPVMQGTVNVSPGGPATVTVNIVDAPAMGFSPAMVTVGVGGTVRWENHSQQHHTVTSRQGATMATHSLNGRGFVGNSPTIVARARSAHPLVRVQPRRRPDVAQLPPACNAVVLRRGDG